ncbi:DUF4163 domain-containing protein [Clostridium sp.]|uniref:PdaC/SigV domain-containing protein n=1 Tax=Clostridium sp. TaxID=1506 RepID=UPI001A4CED25|nr:DUF4163 domain-containing protein [Clostridium sp.]MBK5239880.1 DUF4163 domain-containing protein [Clostridium sp.]
MVNTHKNSWGKITGLTACLVIICVVLLNVNPVIAATVAHIPGMSRIVKVLTFGRHVINDGGCQADVKIPKIEGLLDQELQNKLNKDFRDNANAIILAFESDMKELKNQFSGEKVNLGIDTGYIVKTDNESILAIDVHMLNTVGSLSTTRTL